MAARRTSEDGESGFTLLEIMVGLLISSMIMVSLSMAIQSINRGFDQATQSLERQGTIATALHVVAEDISRIERPVDDPENPTRFLFTGKPQETIYILAERPGNNPAGLYWVRLLVRAGNDGTELVRMRAPYSPSATDLAAVAWGDEVVLIRGNMVIEFAYRAPRAKLRSWASGWEASNMLPGQVKIEITDLATGRLRVPAFVANLKINAEAACAMAETPGCTLKSEGALVPPEAKQ